MRASVESGVHHPVDCRRLEPIRTPGLALLDPSLLATTKKHTVHVGGAGGVIEVKQRVLPHLSFRFGNSRVQLNQLSLVTGDKAGAAQVGMDVVSQFSTFILDFDHMRMDGRLKTAAELKTNAQPTMKPGDVKLDDKKAGGSGKPHSPAA